MQPVLSPDMSYTQALSITMICIIKFGPRSAYLKANTYVCVNLYFYLMLKHTIVQHYIIPPPKQTHKALRIITKSVQG